jgi:hypothetical protein
MTDVAGTGRQTSAKATLSPVLGGWSGAEISSTSLSVADFSLVSRGNLPGRRQEVALMPEDTMQVWNQVGHPPSGQSRSLQ